MLNVAILGYGTVGSGVYDVICQNGQKLAEKIGQEMKVKYVLDLRDFPGNPVEEVLVHDFKEILEDKEVDIIAEVMGGVEPAYTFVKQALEAGKSVATSNKELVAKYGAILIQIAKEHKVNFLFEASVGGGIPIIRPLNSCITADEITSITGILNGTTNYMLTKMSDEGMNFEEVLKDAQDKGYAERNPEADVEGYDACRKIAILTSLAYGKQVDYEDIPTTGITAISDNDIVYAKELGATIKLLGMSRMVDGKVFARVAPMMIKTSHPLYHVNDVFNAIVVNGNMVDDVMFYGKGAGKLPTASAVVADIVDAARHLGTPITQIWDKEKLELGDSATEKQRFFVRVKSEDIDDLDMKLIKDLFGNVLYLKANVVENEAAFITEAIEEQIFMEGIKQLPNVINTIRVAF